MIGIGHYKLFISLVSSVDEVDKPFGECLVDHQDDMFIYRKTKDALGNDE